MTGSDFQNNEYAFFNLCSRPRVPQAQTRQEENSSRARFIPTDPGLNKLCRARADHRAKPNKTVVGHRSGRRKVKIGLSV